MDFFSGLANYLTGSAALQTLIPNPLIPGTTIKLFQDVADEATQLPFVVFTSHDTDRVVHLRGASAIAQIYFQIDVYALDVVDRFKIGDAIRNRLHGKINLTLTDSLSNSATMEWAQLRSDTLSNHPPPDGTENPVHCREMSFLVTVDEPLPSGS